MQVAGFRIREEIAQWLSDISSDRFATLSARLQKEVPLLHDRLHRLYGCDPQFSNWFRALVKQTVQLAVERSPELWQQDLVREKNPDWHVRGGLAYCAYADKFGGNLQGVRQRIAHLESLGVSYLHLLPFLKFGTPPNDGGFAVASYEDIEPSLGNAQDLQALTQALRQSGISLCSDFVLNHVSTAHEWAQKARAGDTHYQSFFHWVKTQEEVDAFEKNLGQIFPSTAPGNFSFVPEVGAWTWTTFYPYQWDLNYTQPEVFSEMSRFLLQLANQGVEAFRLDSTGFLWKREGTNCMNQPEVHWLLQALRCLSNIAAPGVLLKAEAIMPTQDLPPYFGLGETPGQECHLAYHSSLMSASWLALSEQKTQIIHDVLAHTPALPRGCSWMTYVRCHDDIGWNVLRPEMDARGSEQRQRLMQASQFFAGITEDSYACGSQFQSDDPSVVHGTNGMTASLVGLESAQTYDAQELAVSRHTLMHSLSLFVGGLPLIYMGDEFGLTNTSEEELAQRQGADGRELHRPRFDEHAFAQLAKPQSVGARIFKTLQQLAQVRKTHEVFQHGHDLSLWFTRKPEILAIQRGTEALAVFNFSQHEVVLAPSDWVTQPKFSHTRNMLTQQAQPISELRLGAYAWLWLAPVSDANLSMRTA